MLYRAGGGVEEGPKESWSNKVDDFGPTKPHSQACLEVVKRHPEAIAALYKGANERENPKSQEARKDFLDYLQFVVMPPMQRREPANEKAIKLEEFLGENGLTLYKAALEEEARSQAFRDAVFQRSTNHYDGPTWSQRLIAPFAGPSAAGKSVSQPALVAEIAKQMPKSNSNAGNDVVSVDGGVEREVSQVRSMVLQVALAKGFKGISDLDKKENKSKVSVKNLVKNTVLQTPGLNMIIPKTYTNQAINIVKGIPGRGSVGSDEFKKFDKVDNGTAIVAFGIVEAEHSNVAKNGASRAWNGSEFTEADIKMNAKPPCESKAYHDHWKAGTNLSNAAKENYLRLDEADNKSRICVTVTSDFTFIKPDPKAPGGWSLAGKDEEWNSSMMGILRRDFEKYQSQALNKSEQDTFRISQLKIAASSLATYIDMLNTEYKKMNKDSPEGAAKLQQIENVKKQSSDVVGQLADLLEENESGKKGDIKSWLKQNGWSPPIVAVEVTKPNREQIVEGTRKKSVTITADAGEKSTAQSDDVVARNITMNQGFTNARSRGPSLIQLARKNSTAPDVESNTSTKLKM